jgi:NAD+ diphosphatase
VSDRGGSFVAGREPPAPPTPDALWFAVRGQEVLAIPDCVTKAIPCFGELNDTLEPEAMHYLGALAGVDCYAACLAEESAAPSGLAFEPLRPLLMRVEEGLGGVAGLAVQIVEWERTHRFCGRCGAPTEDAPGERAKRCAACNLHAFPRVAPAVIVRVTRGEEILLAHGRRFVEPMYSVLAGFVDPGESLEQAVHRELREETAIEVGGLAYFGSQPWPFPHSLMVAFTAEWTGGEIRIDEEELVDARWFCRDALPAVPPPLSIARRLIDDWAA